MLVLEAYVFGVPIGQYIAVHGSTLSRPACEAFESGQWGSTKCCRGLSDTDVVAWAPEGDRKGNRRGRPVPLELEGDLE